MEDRQKFLSLLKTHFPTFVLGIIIGAILCRFSETLVESSSTGVDVKGIATVSDRQEEEVDQVCDLYVDVGGAVAKPGVYCLKSEERLVNAVKMAGGFISESYASKYVSRYLNLALPLKEDQKIYIPYQNDLQCSLIPYELRAEEEKEVINRINSGDKKDELEIKAEEEESCISVNTATKTRLLSVSGIGESMAEKIIAGRPYKELTDLKSISGVGEATYEKFLPFICL